MWRNKWKKVKSGWQKDPDDDKNNDKNEIKNEQIIQTVARKNIFERFFKWIIYFILFISIPRYLKSSKSKGKEIVNNAYAKLNSNEFAFIPVGYAMYLFLSFIPISIILVSIIAPIRPEYDVIFRYAILGRIIPGIESVLPKSITEIWTSAGGATTFVLLALSIIFFTSKGYAKFIVSIDVLYEHQTTFRMWKGRIKGVFVSIFLILALTLILLGFTAFMTFLVEKANFGDFSNVQSVASVYDLKLTWHFWFIYYLLIVIMLPPFTYLGFALFYLYAPNFKLKFSHVHPGALITAIPTSLFILIFGSLTSIFNYQKFGPVAAFMYLILLLTFMAYFTYAGVIVNSSFYKTFVNIITIDKRAFFKGRKNTINID